MGEYKQITIFRPQHSPVTEVVQKCKGCGNWITNKDNHKKGCRSHRTETVTILSGYEIHSNELTYRQWCDIEVDRINRSVGRECCQLRWRLTDGVQECCIERQTSTIPDIGQTNAPRKDIH